MKSVAVIPGTKNGLKLIDTDEPRPGYREALVKVLDVGVCGTDEEIVDGKIGKSPAGEDFLIIGHEVLGMIESIGSQVGCFCPGDLVTSTVRRPCPEHCLNCRNGQADMCLTGDYLERGIKGLHGFMSGYFVESIDYLVKVPPELSGTGVLLEPMSIVEKGLDQLLKAQKRLLWRPSRALVLGAGPIGMLATFALRDMGLETFTMATRDRMSIKARAVESSGARYVNAREEPLETLTDRYGVFDIIIEATGVGRLALQSMDIVNTNGAVCLLGLSPGKKREEICADCINMDMVMDNSMALGSVSSNRIHFEMGIERLLSIQRKWPGLLEKMFSERIKMAELGSAIPKDREDIKVVVEVGR